MMARMRAPGSGSSSSDAAQISAETCAPRPGDAAASQEAASADVTDDAAVGSPGNGPARAFDGRFKEGHSGNPRGRPRKAKPAPEAVLTRVLDEELPNKLPGQSGRISMREALIRSLCVRALKDPRIALALLKLETPRRDASDDSEDVGALLAEEEAALDDYLARERRKPQRPRAEGRP